MYNIYRNPRGAYTPIVYLFVQPPRGYLSSFNKNIVGILYPKIWPLGGLQGYWGFSGDAIYTYTGRGVVPRITLGVFEFNFYFLFMVKLALP